MAAHRDSPKTRRGGDKRISFPFANDHAKPNKAVESDGDKRVFFGLQEPVTGAATGHIIRVHYSVPRTSRAISLASLTLFPPRLTADVRLDKKLSEDSIALLAFATQKIRKREATDQGN